MFLGHFAVALAAKRAAPRASLGVLVGASLFLDLLWPCFLFLGWESVRIAPGHTAFVPLNFNHYPWSHSLAGALLWAILFGSLYGKLTGDRRGAGVSGALVLSHWALDAVAHAPDLPLFPGGAARVGLGLWRSVAGSIAVESALFAAGVWLYAAGTRPRGSAGFYGFAGFALTLALLFAQSARGLPPPDTRALAYAGLAALIFPLWAAGFDARRSVKE